MNTIKIIIKELLITVAAWDGTTLAIDSRMTQGGIVVSDKFVKMVEINHPNFGRMVGVVAGTCLYIGPWVSVIEEDGFVPCSLGPSFDEESGGMHGLFIDEEGNCWEASTTGGYFPHGKSPTSIGSGSEIALYLLNKGKKAVEAVRGACEANLFCGGDIRSYNSRTKKFDVVEVGGKEAKSKSKK